MTITTLEGAEIKPGKHSYTRINLSACCVGGLLPFMINITHLRIKPLPLTNSHGRHMTVMIHPNGHLCPFGSGRYIHTTVINL
jgi:hypothetical protein